MTYRSLKTGYFVLEGLNSFSTTLYFYYVYFFMQREFGFSNRDNLLLSATNGFLYMFAAWLGGRFGQKHGYCKALGLGFSLMAVTLLAGSLVGDWKAQVALMLVCTLGLCLTWPALEALVSENETPAGLQAMVGVYNMVWAGTGALAFFAGGALLEHLGLRSLFWIPASVLLVQLGFLSWLRHHAISVAPLPTAMVAVAGTLPPLNPRPIARTKAFLIMAWLANPFAYVAVNTVVAVGPGLAQRLELSPMWAGFFCSIWFFARLGAFWVLWFWDGWHYRFRWFISAFLLLIAGFAAMLLVTKLWVVVAAQIGFGIGLGLIYYSSLFYSMDLGDTKGEHGGLHEAAIGAGLFAGPATGAAALYLYPDQPNSGAIAVSVLLMLGLLCLLLLRFRPHWAFSPIRRMRKSFDRR